MSQLVEMKQLLFEELEHIVKTSSNLIMKISDKDWDYRPASNMRSLLELVHHLVSVPGADLLIMREKPEEEVRQLEGAIAADGGDKDKLIAWMNKGLADLKSYMDGLSDDDFLHKKTTPFYLEHGSAQAKWLIEVVTHAQHHRAQMFNYLKAQGYEVSMFDLY
ncbi:MULTISPECIES: DinB family protein [Paenibacillus]|uniref:DinB family protein n=3 Tax=Paenibacillus TaxID=44249 RepID=G4HK68_9BACL|nr:MULTISPECIES: DinB family protein [Paenibacillus]EHB62269.1 DinB family protein [Paenibacillus lactis 154]MBP1895622.1 putative damage-inducible protein DinB [Paenibacillus lactis]MCM3494931.1 DinB family protein [Paenibacillus lactis]OOC58562.1 damage-inducible protein DinB [Paenibacillus ihbetae]HAG00049.1 DinB family protein [Paenibacillus lactis]